MILLLLLFTPLSGLFAQEKSGEVLQMLEKKELAPKVIPKKLPVIEKEKEPLKRKLPPGKKVLIKKIKVEGATLISSENIVSIVSPHEGRELAFEDIQTVAELITAKYRDEGYIIVNAFVPAQTIKDGTVTIKVVEGKIGNIIVAGNKNYSTSFIEKHIAQVKKDASLKGESLERALLIMNEYPSLNVKASLKAGKEPGTTDIIVAAEDKFPISGSIFYDNFGTSIVSKHRVGAALNIGNIITSGDLIALTGIIGIRNVNVNKLSYGRAEYRIVSRIFRTFIR